MKVSELLPEQKAELKKRCTEAGINKPIHLMTVEKVEALIEEAQGTVGKTVKEVLQDAKKELDFNVDVFKPVIKINDEGNEYQSQEPTELKFKDNGLKVTIGGKIPAGQSFAHPKNSLIIDIEGEKFIMSADLASKIFDLKD